MRFYFLKFNKLFVLILGLLLLSCNNNGDYDCWCNEQGREAFLIGYGSDDLAAITKERHSEKATENEINCIRKGYESFRAGEDLLSDSEVSDRCNKKTFLDILFEGGTIGQIIIIILFILSIITVYLFFERLVTIKKALKQEKKFFHSIKDFIHDEKYDSAIDLCKKTDSPIARMLEKGILRINKSLKDISTTINNVGKLELSKLENNLAILGTISGAAPMIGFLGTAIGMIIAFFKMAEYGDQGIDITLLSEGIYLAMTTTVAGLIVGILAYFSYNYLVAKIAKAVYQMESTTIEFLDLIYDKKHN